jgi:hypothetical protein
MANAALTNFYHLARIRLLATTLVGSKMTRARHHCPKIAAVLGSLPILGALAMPAPLQAAGTPAGTNINNVATATYEASPGGPETSVESNTVTLKVDELLDVTVASADPADVTVSPGAANQVLRFTVSNGGNGTRKLHARHDRQWRRRRFRPGGHLGGDR